MKRLFLIITVSVSMTAAASSFTEIPRDNSILNEKLNEETPPEEKKQHRWLKPLLVAGAVIVVAAGGVMLVKRAGATTANNAKVTEASKASRVADEAQHAVIQAGKELQAQARQGKKMSEPELEQIYQARQAELATTEMTERIRRQQLKELENTFSIVKHLTEGIPQMQYSDEFTAQMNAIINNTEMADELQQFVRVGNLQEVVWRLEEAGLHDEALQFEQILQKGMNDEYSFYYKPMLKEINFPLQKLNNGMVIISYSDLQHLIAYKLDKLFGTRVVPLVVNTSEVQLSGRHIAYSVNNRMHIERALSSHNVLMSDEGEVLFGNKYLAYLDFIGVERAEPPLLTNEHLSRMQLLRYVTGFREAKEAYPLRGRAFDSIVMDSMLYKPKNVMDVSQLDFVGAELMSRLQNITLDDFSEVFLADKYGSRHGGYDKEAREAYDRLQTYIEAAKGAVR